MSTALLMGIPLSRATREAWRSQGVTLVRPTDPPPSTELLINYGYRGRFQTQTVPIKYNTLEQVRISSNRERFNQLFQELIPTIDGTPSLVWLKGPGRKGQNKVQVHLDGTIIPPQGWELQKHVDGTEYRINSVGNRIVQCHLRHGTLTERSYEWIRMRDVPDSVKNTVRAAALVMSEATHPMHTLAWDVINTDERAYILECNTAPGMNEATAARVLTEIHRQLEDENV